jgi:hypothetical protein
MESTHQSKFLNAESPQDSAADPTFSGYRSPTSNTTYTPNHFFDVVLPHSSRGVVRLVGYMLRRVLGWSNPDGTPQEPQVQVSYVELIEKAGISRGAIRETIDESIKAKFIQCVSAGQPHSSNRCGAPSLFELRWDDREQYVTDPDEFNGFYSGNGNLTYIPNDFFDYTVRHESLSLVRVVGAIIRHSIGFQTRHGFRRQQVSLSFDDLLRITRLGSRSTLNLAIQQALENHHIIRVETGAFGNGIAKAATYSIRWHKQAEPNQIEHEQMGILDPYNQSVQKSNQENIRDFAAIGSKIEPRSVQKSNQGSVQKSNQEAFKNRTSIEITDLNNKNKQQQQRTAAAAVPSYALLKEIGFDSTAAQELSERFPENVICNQISWLSSRNAVKNRLGLLRRSIEENWPAPEGEPVTVEGRAGEAFAKHYYAGYHGNTEPAAKPFPRDCIASQNFLAKLGLSGNEKAAAEAGKAFGKLVRDQHHANPKAQPFLGTALVLFGDEFVRSRHRKTSEQKRSASQTAQEAHKRANWSAYMSYLCQDEKSLQQVNAALYAAFEDERQRGFESMRQFNIDPARFQTEEARLVAWAEFFSKHSEHRVFDFWEWDSEMNQNGFTPDVVKT